MFYYVIYMLYICFKHIQFVTTTAVLNDKEKTQKHYVSKFNAVQ